MLLKSFVLIVACILLWSGSANAAVIYNPNVNSFYGSIDFNFDSITDISLDGAIDYVYSNPPTFEESYYFRTQGYLGPGPAGSLYELYSGSVLVGSDTGNDSFASSLALGTLIGPTTPQGTEWSNPGSDIAVQSIVQHSDGSRTKTPAITGNDYFGFQFQINTEIHYGWMAVDRMPQIEAPRTGELGALIQTWPRILSWAYESNANTSISVGAVPEPASCGAAICALVAGALVMRRRINRN